MKKFSSAYFPLFVCFFNMQFPRNLGCFYWRKKAAFFSYTAVCLLGFLICCSHEFLLFFVVREESHNVFALFSTLSSSSTARAMVWSPCRKPLSLILQVLSSAVLLSLMWWAQVSLHRDLVSFCLLLLCLCGPVSGVLLTWAVLCKTLHIHVPALLTGSQNFLKNHLWQKNAGFITKGQLRWIHSGIPHNKRKRQIS